VVDRHAGEFACVNFSMIRARWPAGRLESRPPPHPSEIASARERCKIFHRWSRMGSESSPLSEGHDHLKEDSAVW
jgi:hypothetical protein